ncbi:hypothetical protein [Frankia sp. Cas3]|uniref:TolB family protein n=1 Tax=Frankia sp. Cas3 TaxID=3073926 RepID=UPI002AD55B1B|nr:hypothetical protein [Frankia sp. Cas3]
MALGKRHGGTMVPLALAMLASVCIATVGCTGSGGTPSTPPARSGVTADSGGAASTMGNPGPAPPRTLAAVTTAGAVVLLDPVSGRAIRTLRGSGAVGDSLAVSPDGRSVFYEVGVGCQHQVWRIGTDGGDPTIIASAGSKPAISPNGTSLAYATQYFDCSPGDNPTAGYQVVVVNLTTHAERRFPMPPGRAASGLPAPVTHLSWSPDGTRLAVSVGSAEDNEGWDLVTMSPSTESYYLQDDGSGAVPLTAAEKGSFYYEGVYMPNGHLFVVRQCCGGYPPVTTSVLLQEVDPATGAPLRQIATGLTSKTHTSLDVDAGGHWLLYLSGTDLEVSSDGAKPTTLASGYRAAAW